MSQFHRNILQALCGVLVLAAAGVVAVPAQTNLLGTYFYDTKIDDGRHDFRRLVELRARGVAVYRNEQEGAETQRRAGTWRWNRKTNLVTLVFPPVKNNPMQGQEIKLTFVFKYADGKLQMTKDLPYNEGVGNVYRKL